MAERAVLALSFLSWLVEARSNNQLSTLKLYKVITENKVAFENDPALFAAAQELTAIAFSLWRAVFLSDLDETYEKQSANLESFLLNLIAHNSIQYMTDFNSREWSFWYYLRNATSRLDSLSDVAPEVVSTGMLDPDGTTAKDRWQNAQAALERAIDNLAQVVFER